MPVNYREAVPDSSRKPGSQGVSNRGWDNRSRTDAAMFLVGGFM